MSIASDLTAVATNLNSALDEINTKIEAKGGTASETVYGVAAAVENLPSGGETSSPNIIKAGTSNPLPIQLSNGSWFLPNYNSYNWGKLMSNATTGISINPSQSQIRYVVKFKMISYIAEWGRFIGGDIINDHFPHLGINSDTRKIFSELLTPSSEWRAVYADYVIEPNTWYYACLYFFAEVIYCSLYDESGTLLATGERLNATPTSETNKIILGGTGANWGILKASEIDLSETLVELNGTIIWGKTNSKTKNMRIYDITDFSEFTQVEYIESTGTQYINTEYRISESGLSRFYIECEQSNQLELNSTVFGTYMHLGKDYPMVALDIFPASPAFTGLKYDEPPSSVGIIDATSFYGNKHTVDLTLSQSSYTLIADGVATSGQIQRGDLSIFTYPCFLFARSSNEAPVGNYAQIKIGRFKLYDSTGNIRRDFVPCYHTATGVIGMFDLVNNKFYMNAGTGTFLKGADVNV